MAVERKRIKIKTEVAGSGDRSDKLQALIENLKNKSNQYVSLREKFLDKNILKDVEGYQKEGIDWDGIAQIYSLIFETEEPIKTDTLRNYVSYGRRINGLTKGSQRKKSTASSSSRKKSSPVSEISSTGDSQVMKSPAPVHSEEPEQPVVVVETRPEESVSKPVIAEKAIIEQEKTEEPPVVEAVQEEPVVQENKVDDEAESGSFVAKMPESIPSRASKISRMRGR